MTDEEDSWSDPLSVGGTRLGHARAAVPRLADRASCRAGRAPATGRWTRATRRRRARTPRPATSCGLLRCQAPRTRTARFPSGRAARATTRRPRRRSEHPLHERHGSGATGSTRSSPCSATSTVSAPGKVPDRNGGEHANGAGAYLGQKNCMNPIPYAKDSPDNANAELCNLPARPPHAGPRLLRPHRRRPLAVPDGERRVRGHRLDEAPRQGSRALRRDRHRPAHDPVDRAARRPPGADAATDLPDPVHGREWSTGGTDLEFACTFDLYENAGGTIVPTRRTCAASDTSCDCDGKRTTPLCDPRPYARADPWQGLPDAARAHGRARARRSGHRRVALPEAADGSGRATTTATGPRCARSRSGSRTGSRPRASRAPLTRDGERRLRAVPRPRDAPRAGRRTTRARSSASASRAPICSRRSATAPRPRTARPRACSPSARSRRLSAAPGESCRDEDQTTRASATPRTSPGSAARSRSSSRNPPPTSSTPASACSASPSTESPDSPTPLACADEVGTPSFENSR